ncbi:RNA-binding domain-containing protein [Cutaneotrichosporon oleaginosum]|uniref:RNA-binding domain-containing protein n=1 Tax=Cutaneotrichosporon oleaginosum TaxID=879819 RepID=A0A0J0XRS6_9TREE|nr:RNA-binding domain-containing protein [Cutaneotrichosporon oleaginosum]KLT43797.1 RNA-binding domain-containing protein [Cutaneotrichosporon oleaginosum]TXT06461.1 hypothetical protein COLE_05792 [Cutaneotrichosporon oleaginosum]
MPPTTRTVFVANVPYDVSEEQIAGVFSEVGPVAHVEIKFDPQTGKSKGYAFVQFYDEAAAQSAMRNLQEVPINGRPVRIELSNDERLTRRPGQAAGPGPVGGPAPFGGRSDSPAPIDHSLLPPGTEPGPGQKATDAISKTLAEVNPGQMQEVMAGMKALITTQPDEARRLLAAKPQLAYAIFQAMLLMNIVDASVLQRIQPLQPAAAAAPVHAPPPAPVPAPAPGPGYGGYQREGYYPPPPVAAAPPAFRQPPHPPQPQAAYAAPPPAPAYGYRQPPAPAPAPPAPPALPPATQAALAGLPEEQKAMLMQVLQLTPDQINALDPEQQASVRQLRAQFLGAGA